MRGNTFILTALLTALGPTLLAQPNFVFSPTALSAGVYGSVYTDQTLTVTGGTPPYTFSISKGKMPPGMALSDSGVLSGTPAAAGTYSFTVTAKSSPGPPGGGPGGPPGQKKQSGSQDYKLVVDQASLTIAADNATMIYGGPVPALSVSYTGFINGDDASSLTTPPTISTTGTSSSPPGNYPITVAGATDAKYNIVYKQGSLTINKRSQQITWTQSLSVGCGSSAQLQLNATASSGLPVTYSVSDPNVATVSGNVLTLLQPGTAVVTAAQAGNADFNAAPAVADTTLYQPASLVTEHWNDVLFFDNSSGDYIRWQWYKNGVAVPDDNTPYYSETPSLDGQYYVIATNKDGQQIQSCTLTVAPGAAIPGGIKVFPNPANRSAAVTVVSNYAASMLQGATLQIADMSGRVLQVIPGVQPSMQVTMPSAGGIYIVNLLLSDGQKISSNVLIEE